ncbi:MAG: DNA polymerase IV [Candidatus Omnitrophota bacterium]
MQKERFIAHVDMDAFFAAIEQRDNPALRGKPVVIGADPKEGKGRGVVSTCSYEARKFGIHSAMPISIAYRKCPEAIFLPVNGEKYSEVSSKIYKIFYEFTPEVEPISIDEAFLDITGSFHLFGTPQKTCLLIKSKIKEKTSLTASVGLAPIKMAAKIASDLKKPDGFVEVASGGVLDFLWPLDIRKMWGLGQKSEILFRGMGINTIGDIAKRSADELMEKFGKNGLHLWKLANGIDERDIEIETEEKSVGNEITFSEDTLDERKIKGALMRLSEKVSGRLRCLGIKGRTVTLKIRLEGFKTYTRAKTISESTSFSDVLYKEIETLYNHFDTRNKKIRLLGVRVTNLVRGDFRDSLFSETADRRRENIHRAIDKIKSKFGNNFIYRAVSKFE